ncbi:hypothetical protein ACFQ4Z_12180 [Oceanobacillus oncorhynchi subsp. oncorhynchi]|uniref:hypothetical protein n=1 Tax=Oceanobacillus oncorhynchi TaxID=545501 RepID=UPI0036367457
MAHDIFLRSFVSSIEGNLQVLKKLEEGKERGNKDAEFLAYCKGGIDACERILDFEKELNANEK